VTPEVKTSVRRTSIVAAGLGAILSPIPLIDELVLFPLYGNLALRVGRAHGLDFAQVPWRPAARTAFNGLVARAGLNLAVSYIPGVAAVANAASAAILTELFGEWLDGACERPAEAKPWGIREVANMLTVKIGWKERPVSAASMVKAPPPRECFCLHLIIQLHSGIHDSSAPLKKIQCQISAV